MRKFVNPCTLTPFIYTKHDGAIPSHGNTMPLSELKVNVCYLGLTPKHREIQDAGFVACWKARKAADFVKICTLTPFSNVMTRDLEALPNNQLFCETAGTNLNNLSEINITLREPTPAK